MIQSPLLDYGLCVCVLSNLPPLYIQRDKKGFFPQSIQFVELDRENEETDKLNEGADEIGGEG